MLRQLIICLCVTASAAQAFAAEAGRVVFVAGQAQVASHPAMLNAAIQEGDEMATGADGYIYMKTVDAGFLILRPNSRAKVIAYHIDAANPANTRVKLELLSGVARSISGTQVKQARQNFRFNTPVAAIGVRGTDFIVYTNQQSSWVSVVSGGVVVSGFAGTCGPEGNGPCEGSASRELFAGRPDVMLQVQRGRDVPQLLHNTVVAPELNVPPRSDEPVGKAGNGGGASASTLPAVTTPPVAIGDIKFDPNKNAVPVPPAANGGNNEPGGGVTAPPVVVDVPTPTPTPTPTPLPETPAEPVVVRAPNEVLWGRWQEVAGLAPDAAVNAKLRDGSYNAGIRIGAYQVARLNNASFVMPKEGKASFAMVESEATLQKGSGPAQLAQVSNAHFDVDFGARSFTTSLTIANTLGLVNFNAHGDITKQGGIEEAMLSASRVRGYLGGPGAAEAVYVFKGSAGDLTANGVVRWSR